MGDTGKRVSVEDLLPILQARGAAARSVTAIAGPPGSGKSWLAERLAEMLNAAEPGSAAVLPMDGYHYDDLVLVPKGWRPRKGAPHTFDVRGFAHMLGRLRANDAPEVAVPVFDRAIEIARAGARLIPASVRHLLVEGNYLLLDQAPWPELGAHFDTTVFLEVPIEVLTERLAARWHELTGDDLVAKMEGNDLPNARLVNERRLPADFVVTNL